MELTGVKWQNRQLYRDGLQSVAIEKVLISGMENKNTLHYYLCNYNV